MSEHHLEIMNEDVDTIIKLAQEYDLDALTVVDGEFELSLTRREPQPPATLIHAAPSAVAVPQPQADVPVSPAIEAQPEGNAVTAPIIGVFYRASSPEAPPFVNVGDRVTIGQTLCILEAMKLMNEITSDYSGIITAVHVENAELVTIGQALFTVAPLPV